MTDEIAFSGRLTYDDALKARRLFRSPRKVPLPMLFLLAMLLALAAWIVRTLTATEVRSSIALFTIVIPSFGCLGWFLYWLDYGGREKMYLARTQLKNGTFSDDGVRLGEEGVTLHVEWKAISGFKECDGMLFLLRGRDYFALASYMFQTPEDWDRVRTLIREKLNPIPIREDPSTNANPLPVTL